MRVTVSVTARPPTFSVPAIVTRHPPAPAAGAQYTVPSRSRVGPGRTETVRSSRASDGPSCLIVVVAVVAARRVATMPAASVADPAPAAFDAITRQLIVEPMSSLATR